jgi:hypothetical protein
VTDRQDLEGAHEPNHKLVKARTVLLKRQHGRVHTAAKKAFERAEIVCKQIVEASKQPDTGSNVKSASSFTSIGNDSPTPGGTEGVPDNSGLKYTTRASAVDMWEDSRPSPQSQSGDLPTCGACDGPLSFPFWGCIFCKGQSLDEVVLSRVNTHVPSVLTDLFICDLCDTKGVSDLIFFSEKHTEEHHLIRCLAPEAKKAHFSTEKRLTSLETRLDSHSNDIHNLSGRIGNMQQLLRPAGSSG